MNLLKQHLTTLSINVALIHLLKFSCIIRDQLEIVDIKLSIFETECFYKSKLKQ